MADEGISRKIEGMPSEVEKIARHIVHSLYVTTGGRPQQWRSLAGISETRETEAAVQLAVDRGWLLIERGHSICLTDEGRRIASASP